MLNFPVLGTLRTLGIFLFTALLLGTKNCGCDLSGLVSFCVGLDRILLLMFVELTMDGYTEGP